MNDHAPSYTVGKLALGTVQFGLNYGISNSAGQTTQQEVVTILKSSLVFGLNVLDTAFMYGTSEEVLGNTGLNSQFKIISKYPVPEAGLKIADYLQKSLNRLQVGSLYGYLAHSADSLLENKLEWIELKNLKATGLVSKIGYSLYSPEQLKNLLSREMIPDLVQVPYNVFDRRFEPWFGILKNNNVEIHTRSSFLQGLLLVDPKELSSYFDPVRKNLMEIRGRFASVEELSGALLYFCTNNPMIDQVIMGVNDANQLGQNIKSILSAPLMNWSPFENISDEILLPFNWPK